MPYQTNVDNSRALSSLDHREPEDEPQEHPGAPFPDWDAEDELSLQLRERIREVEAAVKRDAAVRRLVEQYAKQPESCHKRMFAGAAMRALRERYCPDTKGEHHEQG
jgi:hypothetical protein